MTAKVRRTETRRLGYAYPVYDRDFEGHLKVLDRWAEDLRRTARRSAVRACSRMTTRITPWPWRKAQWIRLNSDGSFDLDKWHAYRRVFETHVVED